jgi:hypothetical protein
VACRTSESSDSLIQIPFAATVKIVRQLMTSAYYQFLPKLDIALPLGRQ